MVILEGTNNWKNLELLNDILEETEIAVECSVLDVSFSFDFIIIWGAERHHYSTFDVQCWMLDVHFFICSMFIFLYVHLLQRRFFNISFTIFGFALPFVSFMT